MRAAAFALAMAPLACLRSTSFSCDTNDQCGTGVCQPTHFCSFADAACPSGQRYGELSGSLAGECVVGSDAGGDGPATACKTDPAYQPLAGATATYKLLATAADWQTQSTACMGDGAFLGVPDDAAELTAVSTLAAADFWVGITDGTTENTFLTVLGATAAFLPWDTASGQPDNQQNQDCVRAAPTTQTYFDDKCNVTHVAVCECAP